MNKIFFVFLASPVSNIYLPEVLSIYTHSYYFQYKTWIKAS